MSGTFEYAGRQYSWEDELTESTLISVDGAPAALTLGRLIAMTNGDVLAHIPDEAPRESDAPSESSFGIFAVPSVADPMWDFSTEATPHMTMLWFGDVPDADVSAVLGELRTEMRGMEPVEARVVGRGLLGEDADVLLVDPGPLRALRDRLLAHSLIRELYESAHQHPEWTPHVTAGYPDRPAAGTPPRSVLFDAVEVWHGGAHHSVELVPDPVEAALYATGVRGSGFRVLEQGEKGAFVASGSPEGLLGAHGLGRGFDALVASGKWSTRRLLAWAVVRAGDVYGSPKVSMADAERWAADVDLANASDVRYDEAAMKYLRSSD